MASWLSLTLPLVTALGIIGVLGLPAAFALRLRGFSIALVAVPAGFAVLAIAPIAASFLGISWNLLPPLAIALALALILFLLRHWLGRSPAFIERPHRFWVPIASAAVGGLVVATTLVMSMKTADAVSQTYDAIFHLNLTREMLSTGDASPLHIDLASPGHPAFYPAVWHAFVALIAQVSGASVPLATNAALFAACAVAWPIGAVALGRAVAGPSRRVTLLSGIIAVAFPSFPLMLAGYGVLYPNLLSMTLVPFALVGLMQLLGIARARRSDPLPSGTRWLLFIGATGAATLAHPNAVHLILLWAAVPVVYSAIRTFQGGPIPTTDGSLVLFRAGVSARRMGAALGVILFGACIIAAWYLGHTSDNAWEGTRSPLGAFIDAAGSTPRLEGHAWPVTILVLIGAFVAWRVRSLRWIIGSAAVLLFMFVVALGFGASDWRTMLIGPWYNDTYRLASLVPFGALPLAVLGASAFAALTLPGLRRAARLVSPRHQRGTKALFAAVGLVFVLAATQGAGAHAGVQYVSGKYRADDQAHLLSNDERALLDRLPEHVPLDETVAVNPWNGGALAYAISNRDVFVAHTGGTPDPTVIKMTESLKFGTAESCAAADELDARFVLDFGDHFVFRDTDRALPYRGVTNIGDSPVFTEVDREGDAALYEITGCR